MKQVVLSDVIWDHNEAPYHELRDEDEDIHFSHLYRLVPFLHNEVCHFDLIMYILTTTKKKLYIQNIFQRIPFIISKMIIAIDCLSTNITNK
jgi:hypothetical protein